MSIVQIRSVEQRRPEKFFERNAQAVANPVNRRQLYGGASRHCDDRGAGNAAQIRQSVNGDFAFFREPDYSFVYRVYQSHYFSL